MAGDVIPLFPPYAGVYCLGLGGDFQPCGKVDLSERDYIHQLNRPDCTWRCPRCGAEAIFDDERFEEIHHIGATFPVNQEDEE